LRAPVRRPSQELYLDGVRFPPLIRAAFAERPNRFLVRAAIESGIVEAACGDPGRLIELFRPGVPLLLMPCDGVGRRTRYTVALVRNRGHWVSVLPVLANRLFSSALAAGRMEGLAGWRIEGREVRHGASRFDFVLRRRGRDALAEVKSVSLVEGSRALFPDAPTLRGTRHVRELTAHRRAGGQGLLAFVVQRADAESVSPHAGIDPVLAEAIAEAHEAGVRMVAYACRMSPIGARIERRIPVVLP
jgi:sugar fermentation stimulation protein A